MESRISYNHQCQVNLFDIQAAQEVSTGENLLPSFSSDFFPLYTHFNPIEFQTPTDPLSDSWNSCRTEHMSNPKPSSFPKNLSFGNPDTPINPNQFNGGAVYDVNHEEAVNFKSCSHTQGRLMSERRRREELTQLFIALSALVPGIKKLDKGCVLRDAINYMKELKDRVKELEEQNAKKPSSNENFTSSNSEELPDIEAGVSDNNIVVKIHCKKHKGVLPKIVEHIEKHHLTIVNASAIPFGRSALDIIIVAQMDVEFSMAVKDLVKNLQSLLLQSM
ncbi:hypothetical protein GIB67_041725 [Kingdonia uniflora]|uniref:BHLH domain-containing protein n=1 Tax=Kingdonia uniflora TaxID=39325 RepID=A0A7J7NNR7_9MAGN|nr:hypothetical protein GIB67_041725 [Kingdonia uniflora]